MATRNRARVPGSRRDIQEQKRKLGPNDPCVRGNNPLAEDREYDRKGKVIRNKSAYIESQFIKFLERDRIGEIMKGIVLEDTHSNETYDTRLLEWYYTTHTTIGTLRTINVGREFYLNAIPINSVTMTQYKEFQAELAGMKLLNMNDLRVSWKSRKIDMVKMMERHGRLPWKIVETYRSKCRVIVIDKDSKDGKAYAYAVQIIGGKEDADYGSLTGREAYEIFNDICIRTTKYNLSTQIKYYLTNHPEIVVSELTAPKPRIESVTEWLDNTITDVYSFDRNRAFGYGIKSNIPALAPAIQYIEDRLKVANSDSTERNFWKSIINMTAGYCGMKDSNDKYKSNNGIIDYYARMENKVFTDNLERLARKTNTIAINYATDCVRVIGKPEGIKAFTNEIQAAYGINNDIGGVKVEVYSKFRTKSDGAYEYVEADGTYKCSYRGKKKPDKIEWGWLYEKGAKRTKYLFDEGGMIKETELDDEVDFGEDDI